MQIVIKYFGQLTDVTQKNEEEVHFSGETVDQLLKELFNKYPSLENKDFRVAQHQELVSNSTKLSGEELALLPAFAGG